MKRTFLLLLLLAVCLPLVSQDDKPIVPPKDTTELHQRIEKILKDNKVPGTGVVIANREGIVWTEGIGKSDVAANEDVSPDTLFRIGSISKTFVALSILKLQEEGRMDLNATVRSLAPEVQFQNRWESTDPVRVVNLLEHTTGWDDLRFKEYASSDPKPLTLEEGLNIAPVSRTSRWKPGTRFSYCNSGPAVAAFVIEKTTGKRFEDYVKESFFEPIGMPTADYFYSPQTQQRLATLYDADGKTPVPYWHISMRPAGAINASAREMGNYVRFFVNRGAVNGVQLVSADSIARMETPLTYYGAQAGLGTGYGLNNYTSLDDNGFVWHGHNGGVQGGLSELAYLPQEGVGYFFSINASSGKAMREMSKLLQAYLTRDLAKRNLPAAAHVPDDIAKVYSGWYEGISPRTQIMYFIEKIAGVSHVTFSADKMTVKPLFDKSRIYVAVTDRLYRNEKQSEPTLALMKVEEGTVIQTTGTTNRQISAMTVFTEIGIASLTGLAVLSTALFALIWIPRWIFRRMRGVKHLVVRLWPLLAVLCLVAAVATVLIGGADFLANFGEPTAYSVGLMLFTIGFAVASIIGLVASWRVNPAEMNRWAYWHSRVSCVLFTVATLYFLYWGIIGYRTWA
ncbi:MAG: serine hydrolase domain-containing protein [Acidobacteriaceae bacterium]